MKNTKAGFSLVEAVITVAIIAMAAVTALSYMAYCGRIAMQADTRLVAVNFARETAEGLYKRSSSDPALSVTSADGVSDLITTTSTAGSKFLSRYPLVTRKYTVVDKGGYKLVTVKVKW
jgi:prepilin-type N-terminal cleavage/methylation domain-containing protein